VEEGYKVAVVE
jgi:DNA mismatch repair ATPase MutS